MISQVAAQLARELPPDLPEAITYAVLTADGELRFADVPSRAELRDGELFHNGPWDAAIEEIGGKGRRVRVARSGIGNHLLAWVADESLLRPDLYPANTVGGRTVNILRDIADEGAEALPWAGPIVITQSEDLRPPPWCGFIWPLDEEQRWLIAEAYRAALGDSTSMLYTDDVDEGDWPAAAE
jgi:hypothetical protein